MPRLRICRLFFSNLEKVGIKANIRAKSRSKKEIIQKPIINSYIFCEKLEIENATMTFYKKHLIKYQSDK